MPSTPCRTPRRACRPHVEMLEDRIALSPAPVTPESLVQQFSSIDSADVAAATADDGRFVVVWTEQTFQFSGQQVVGNLYRVQARLFDRDGNPLPAVDGDANGIITVES